MKKYNRLLAVMLAGTCMFTASACGSENKASVEEEVAEALTETESTTDNTDKADKTESAEKTGEKSSTTEKTDKKTSKTTASTKSDNSTAEENLQYGVNPYLGDTSTATSYDIKFTIETDSGLAGITWGSTDGTDGEYYLVAFDCTRDIPRLYTCRKNGDDTFDEAYTNLDFMFPEMNMFTQISHIVEIKVDGTAVTVLLDSYTASEYKLDHAVTVGQIGAWVMEGDYHEYIDDLFVAEGVNGDGDWIYSDDFSGKTNIFSPELKTRSGRLYVTDGYHTVPKTELMQEQSSTN